MPKFMSLFGCLNPVQDHQAFRMLSDGTIARWPYAEPNSHHNKSKHWVDDANNQRHSPIDLSYSWLTKWWPNRQFTFFLGVAEVNALNSRAHGRRQSEESMITFRKNLAIQMMENVLDDQFVPRQPLRGPITRGASSVSSGEGVYGLEIRPHFTSHWLGSTWKRAKDKYQKTTCTCENQFRTYCRCNKSQAICVQCLRVCPHHMKNSSRTPEFRPLLGYVPSDF